MSPLRTIYQRTGGKIDFIANRNDLVCSNVALSITPPRPPSDRTHCYSATRLMTSPQPWRWGNRSGASPLRREDSIKYGVLPVVRAGRQHEHVLDYVEGEAVVGQRTQELGLQEGRPFLLQNPLSSQVPLQHKRRQPELFNRWPAEGATLQDWQLSAAVGKDWCDLTGLWRIWKNNVHHMACCHGISTDSIT